MPEEAKKISPVMEELKRLKEKLKSLELEKKAKPEIKEKIEKKIEETKEKIEELKEKKEEKKKKVVSGFIKYWQDVRAGKKKTPWEIHKERIKQQEKKEENKTPDKEAEKIKEKLEKIPETEFLKSEEPKEKPKEEKPKEGFDFKKFLQKNDTWLLVLGILLVIWVGMKLLGGKESATQPIPETKKETESEIEWEERNIAPPGAPPKMIRRPKI
jgi:ElaB/YqjD/DUF883 family membrane-anchored ribosome-binding protein